MLENLLPTLTLATALGSGLMAGVFFAFSAFVMTALSRLPPAQGIAAMQSINVGVLNPVFLGVFLGTAALSLLLAIASLMRWHQPGAAHLLTGCLLYLLGTFLVTAACNVPLNDVLARVDPATTEGTNVWASYLAKWKAWNHVRTLAALVGAGFLVAGRG